jgi:hypothetical protein
MELLQGLSDLDDDLQFKQVGGKLIVLQRSLTLERGQDVEGEMLGVVRFLHLKPEVPELAHTRTYEWMDTNYSQV